MSAHDNGKVIMACVKYVIKKNVSYGPHATRNPLLGNKIIDRCAKNHDKAENID